MNKWFRKQYRTDADAKTDARDPNRRAPTPIDDDDSDSDGKATSVAPPATHLNPEEGAMRPLKGGYWFIRDRFKGEVAEAIAKDRERWERTQVDR